MQPDEIFVFDLQGYIVISGVLDSDTIAQANLPSMHVR